MDFRCDKNSFNFIALFLAAAKFILVAARNSWVVRHPKKAKELRLRTISLSAPEIWIFDTFKVVELKGAIGLNWGQVRCFGALEDYKKILE
ncbi:Uncharacterized protein TCM_033044 [Theobroma cacao]|uniref:Uncharacterized protein n=1 Tax=Theobroma cacao TaxID=3641 RepID=A0A061FAF8_THECC|nr:Uncharacterized protein TCM_033044 [Theobroma cacao]